MPAKKVRRRKDRSLRYECLEDRRVMAADLLGQLPSDPTSDVGAIAASGDLDQLLTNADSLTGLSEVRNNYDFIGAGQTVAIIDSGIAWDHISLGGGFGPNYRV